MLLSQELISIHDPDGEIILNAASVHDEDMTNLDNTN